MRPAALLGTFVHPKKINMIQKLRQKLALTLVSTAFLGAGTIKAQSCGVSISATSTLICAGSQVTLTNNAVNSFTWSGGSTAASLAVNPTVTTSYSLSVANLTCTPVITIQVDNTPTVTAVANPSSVCLGKTATLTATGATSFTWSGGITNGGSFTPTATAGYTVTGANSCGTATAAVSVAVLSLPTITASLSQPSVCLGGSVQINAGGGTGYTISPSATANSSFVPSTSNNYTITGVGSNGCTNTATAALTVLTLPTLSLSASSNPVCLGSSVTINANGAVSYTASGGLTPGSAFTPTATSLYTVTGTGANGCTNSSTLNLQVVTTPTITILNSPTVCAGSTAVLNAGGATSYTWSNGVNNNSAFTPTITDSYTVTAFNGCTNTATTTIALIALPNIQAGLSQPSVCRGATVQIAAGGGVSYTVTPTVPVNTAFSPTASTTYTVRGTSAAGCTNSAVTSVTVFALPTVTASISTPSICNGNTVMVSAGGAINYAISSYTLETAISPTVSGTYTITGSDINACTNTATVTLLVINPPTVGFIASSTSVCAGKSLTLTGTGANTYTWTGGVSNGASFTPTATSSYTVSGSNACGSSSSVANVTVNTLPTLTVTVSSPSICSGSTVQITASGATAYSVSPATVTVSTPFMPSATSAYTVTGASANGCTSTAVANISVTTTPSVPPVFSPAAICVGQSATLSATGATGYSWTAANFAGSNSTTVVVNPTVTTTYTLTRNNGGCVTIQQNTLVVNTLPVLNVSAPTTICACTGIATLSATGANTYTWQPAVSFTNSMTVSPCSTTNYTVGASNAFCSTYSTVLVTALANPILTVVASSPSLCAGGTVSMTATGAASYTWVAASALLGTGPVLTQTLNNTTAFVLAGTNANGCIGAVNQLVIVNPNPTLSITGNTSLCTGNSTTLTVTDADANAAVTYSWSAPGFTSTASSNTLQPAATTVYSVTGTYATGCSSKNTVTVTVYNANFTLAPQAAICAGSNATLSASGSATSYAWNTTPQQNGNQVVVSPAISTTYIVTGANNLCTQTRSMSVVVKALPNVSLTVPKNIICPYETISLNASGADTYTWTGGEQSTAINYTAPASAALTSATFAVTGSDAATGCSKTATASVFVSNCTGIEQQGASAAFEVYPNPNNGEFSIAGPQGMHVVLFDELGREVLHVTLTDSVARINAIELKAGVYVLLGSTDNGQRLVKKVIVH